MLLNFLHEDGILFLPIETVCSKLIFPPAPEAERNRQCGPAGWSAEAVFRQSYSSACGAFWPRLSDNAKRSVNFAPLFEGHRVYCSPALRAGLQLTHFPEVISYVQNWFHQEQDACAPLYGAQSNAAAAGRA